MLEPWLVLALYVEEFTCDDVWLLRLSSSISLLGFCKNKRDTRLRPSQAEDRLKCTELGLMTKGLSQSLVILPTLWFHLFRQRLPPSYAASLWRDLAVLAPSMGIFHLSSGHSSTSALLWLKKKTTLEKATYRRKGLFPGYSASSLGSYNQEPEAASHIHSQDQRG